MPRKKTFKKRILDCIGDQKPSPWGLSIGLNHGVIARIFSQDKIPTAPHLITISKALRRSIDWLLTGEEPSGKQPEKYGKNTMAHGNIEEAQSPVYTDKHEELLIKLVEILDGRNRSNAVAIEQNVNAFHQTKDIPIPGKDEGDKGTGNDGEINKKNRRYGKRRVQAG